jgi:hypothetical protein
MEAGDWDCLGALCLGEEEAGRFAEDFQNYYVKTF